MAGTYISVHDEQGCHYVQTPTGALLTDDIGVVPYYTQADAAEVAAALTEGRPVRPLSWKPAPVADPLTVPVPAGTRVLYSGSLEQYRGVTFTAVDCWCSDDCGGYELDEPSDGSHALLEHVRRQSIALA